VVRAATSSDSAGAIRGRVSGAAATEVVAVVLMGPDNVLREAARVRPRADGAWSVSGLAPGAYRILLDAGGGKALEASPPFRSVRLEAGGQVEVAPIEALRVF